MIEKRTIVVLIIILGFFINGFSQKLPLETAQHIKTLSNPEKIEYLGDLCWQLREESNEESILYGKYALALADSLKLYSPAAEISNYLGVSMLYYIYDTKQAREYFRNAMNYGIKSNDSVQIGFAYDNLGYMYLIHGDLSDALEYELSAEKIFTSLKHDEGMAYISLNMGLVFQANKNYNRALEYFNRAKSLHEKNNNEIGIGTALSCIGDTYILKNQPDSALLYFRE